jgi:FkbM family methyltransferase
VIHTLGDTVICDESVVRDQKLLFRSASISRLFRFPGWERSLRAVFPPERFRGPRRVETTVNYDSNLRFRCDLGSYIEWSIFFLGQYGHPTAHVIKSLLREGDAAIDVGANVGVYTLIMAKSVGSSGRVAAFDANPEVHRRLMQNLELNGFIERCETFGCALSSHAGNRKLHLPPQDSWNRGTATLIEHEMAEDRSIEVSVETLDRMMRNWGKCDLIKVDTEGNDFAVLEGARQIIERFLPSLIFEFDPELWPHAQDSAGKLSSALVKLGYSFRFIDQRWGKIRTLDSASKFPRGNIVAFPAKRGPMLL